MWCGLISPDDFDIHPLRRCRQPACHLLTVRKINPPVRDFHPLENFTFVGLSFRKICIIALFQQLTTSVRCMMLMQGTHIVYKHLEVCCLSNITARIKSSCNLIGNRFEMPNVSYTQPLCCIVEDKKRNFK